MKKDRSNLQAYAMNYGARVGILCTISFIFYILELHSSLYGFIFSFVSLSIPFYCYYLARRYRDIDCEGTISFGHAWIFITFMFMFASLLVAGIQYIYFRYIDKGFFITMWQDAVSQFGKNFIAMAKDPASKEIAKKTIETITQSIASLTPIQCVWQILSSNVMGGAIVAVPIALFVKKRNKFY